jgi:predicted nuclease with TOPRIM domain
MDRIISLGTRDEDREKVVEAALGNIEAEANKMDSEVETIRHRLTTVQTEIQNLVGALKAMGSGAVASVKDELVKLEEEKRQLRERLRAHAEQPTCSTRFTSQARRTSRSAMSRSNVVSLEIDFASRSGTTGRSSRPWANCQRCSPLEPKRAWSTSSGH